MTVLSDKKFTARIPFAADPGSGLPPVASEKPAVKYLIMRGFRHELEQSSSKNAQINFLLYTQQHRHPGQTVHAVVGRGQTVDAAGNCNLGLHRLHHSRLPAPKSDGIRHDKLGVSAE